MAFGTYMLTRLTLCCLILCIACMVTQDYTIKSIKASMEFRSDPDKGEAVAACFRENLIDVNNPAHLESTTADINEKIIGRFF